MTPVTTILSIQSSVAYGHVGNSAATFPLMRMGVEVYPVLTVHFSNHTGYGEWRGPLLAAADVADVITGIDERGALARVDAVLSGYQGGEDVGAVILDAVALVKSRNPAAVYCCDPVMGDVGRGFFVRPGIPELMRDTVVPAAQIITPNQFELEYLTGRTTGTVAEVLDAADAARAMGPADRAGHLGGARGRGGRDHRHDRGDGRRCVVGDHPAAAPHVHRGRRPDRGHVPGPPAVLGLGGPGRRTDRRRGLRGAQGDGGVRAVGAAAGGRPGRDRVARRTRSRSCGCAEPRPGSAPARAPRAPLPRRSRGLSGRPAGGWRGGQSRNTSMFAPSAFSRLARSS